MSATQRSAFDPFRGAVEGLAECLRFLTENHAVLNHVPDWIRQPEHGGLDIVRLAEALKTARSELDAFDDHLRRSRPDPNPDSDDAREVDILACCALRFDAYRYTKVSGFDAVAAGEAALEGAALPPDSLQRLAVFFMLQRFLCKWGGEQLPRNGPHWRLFREIFLVVADCRVPVEFRPQDDGCRLRWRYRYRPRIDETVAFIRHIHESTHYRDT